MGISVVVVLRRLLVLLWRNELRAWVLPILNRRTTGSVSSLIGGRLNIIRAIALLDRLGQVLDGLGLRNNLRIVDRLVRIILALLVHLLTLRLLSLHQMSGVLLFKHHEDALAFLRNEACHHFLRHVLRRIVQQLL